LGVLGFTARQLLPSVVAVNPLGHWQCGQPFGSHLALSAECRHFEALLSSAVAEEAINPNITNAIMDTSVDIFFT
jgi:hypothetical protein